MPKSPITSSLDSIILEERPSWKTLWAKNHGNFLLAFVGVIGLVGTVLLAMPSDPADAETATIDNNTLLVDADDDKIYVRVAGAKSDVGSIRLAMYASAEHFNVPKNAMFRKDSEISGGEAIFVFEAADLPPKFALAAYHDINSDGSLNTAAFGIPTEPYGFSNSARGLAGPPQYSEAAMTAPPPGTAINLPIR
ncbi:MAG: DUF2141 domain-containing protein [Planctomycetota bacterium]